MRTICSLFGVEYLSNRTEVSPFWGCPRHPIDGVPFDKGLFAPRGMGGWFEQDCLTVNFVDFQVPVFVVEHWDRRPRGALAKILDKPLCSQRRFLTAYFSIFQPVRRLSADIFRSCFAATDLCIL